MSNPNLSQAKKSKVREKNTLRLPLQNSFYTVEKCEEKLGLSRINLCGLKKVGEGSRTCKKKTGPTVKLALIHFIPEENKRMGSLRRHTLNILAQRCLGSKHEEKSLSRNNSLTGLMRKPYLTIIQLIQCCVIVLFDVKGAL